MKRKTLYEKFEKKLYNEKLLGSFRELIYQSADKFSTRPAFQLKEKDGKYKYVTYAQLKEQFRILSSALIERGHWGKKIGIVGKNSSSWAISYLCAATIGVAVPMDKELSAEDINNFIVAAECTAVLADEDILNKLSPLCSDNVELISLQNIDDIISDFSGNIDSRIDTYQPKDDEMKVLIFTSGTTAKSKGVCLSQKNILSNIYQTVRMVKIRPDDKTLSILPLHHTYECTLNNLLMFSRGSCISYADGLTKIPQNMTEYQPTVLVVVPALLEMVMKRIRKTVAKQCPARYKQYFEDYSFSEALNKVPFFIKYAICQKVRKSLGGKLRVFIVGAADLAPKLVEDYLALGIRTLQGYGLTECSPLLAGNNDFYLNANSTGIAIPGVEIKIDNPDSSGVGEIIARGDNIMLGYYRDEEATARVMRNGYFHTGDLGCMDEDGYLYIKGRLKNVIVTSNGKNIYPEEIETRLKEYEDVSEVLVLAGKGKDNEVCVKAKVLPNLDNIIQKVGHLPNEEEIHAAVKSIIEEINKKLPSYKHIRIIEILSEELEKTSTRKIRRYGMNLA